MARAPPPANSASATEVEGLRKGHGFQPCRSNPDNPVTPSEAKRSAKQIVSRSRGTWCFRATTLLHLAGLKSSRQRSIADRFVLVDPQRASDNVT